MIRPFLKEFRCKRSPILFACHLNETKVTVTSDDVGLLKSRYANFVMTPLYGPMPAHHRDNIVATGILLGNPLNHAVTCDQA